MSFSITTPVRLGVTLLAATLFFTGCGTTHDSVEWRVDPQTQYYARDKDTVFDAMVELLTLGGYEVTREARAAGEIVAQTPLLESRVAGAARQFFITAKLRDLGDGETAVELLVHEAQEGEFKVGATKYALKDHGRYDSIFAALEATLGEDSWLPPSGPDEQGS